MDNDTVRRGRPSVWAAFDEHTAILAGDGLLTMAFELLTDPSVELAPEIRMELVYALARAAGPSGMVGGQQLDLDAARRSHSETSTLAFVEELQALKTGALLTFSAEAGAILSGADGKLRRSLSKYGRTFGLAFQIADDLLDVEGDPATVGKALGKDAGANKATLVSLLGVEGARRQLFSLCDEAVMALEPFGPAADILRDAARFVANRQS
jgi:farnesyl diphosphate synthase